MISVKRWKYSLRGLYQISRSYEKCYELEAVVNDHTLGEVIPLPARSFTPAIIVAVQDVENARDEEGVNVAVMPS